MAELCGQQQDIRLHTFSLIHGCISRSAFLEMDPNVFRKGDSPSILCIDRTWDEILDKPYLFDEMANRVLDMMEKAGTWRGDGNTNGLLTRADTLRAVKKALYEVVLKPLADERHRRQTGDLPAQTEGNIYVDAFWDEIPGVPEGLQEALSRLALMTQRIEANIGNPLDGKSTLMDTKEILNETVLEPMNGVNYDE